MEMKILLKFQKFNRIKTVSTFQKTTKWTKVDKIDWEKNSSRNKKTVVNLLPDSSDKYGNSKRESL